MKRIAALLGVLALTTAAWTTLAQAESAFMATGGGQFLVPEEGGAGSTIAFTARQTSADDNAAQGQVQYVDRSGDRPLVYHGVVTCLTVVSPDEQSEDFDGAGYIEGVWRKSATDEAINFSLYVQDNGEPNQGADVIALEDVAATPDCGDEEDEPDDTQPLARGNVQIHNYESE